MATKLISNPYNNNKYEAKYLNHYECYECGYEWEDAYDCSVDDECPDCGASGVSPHTTEDHPDYEPQKVYVVLQMYKGVVLQVYAYKNNPDPFNKFKYDREKDDGTRVLIVDVNEQQLDGSLGWVKSLNVP